MKHYLEIDKLKSQYSGLVLTSLNRFSRFALVGFSGVFIDLGAFYVLHHFFNLELTPSSMLSTEIAIVNNFIWNDVWTFSDVLQDQITKTERFQRFFKFNLICFLGLIINSLIVNLLFYKFGINEYIAKLVAIGCVTLWNFALNMTFNWKVTRTVTQNL